MTTPTEAKRLDFEDRLQSFVDCLARILARQWLHDEQQTGSKSDSQKSCMLDLPPELIEKSDEAANG